MEKHETPRQKKIGTVLQQEIAALLQNAIRKGNVSNLMISVTKVNVTSDLSIAKVYLSIFPNLLSYTVELVPLPKLSTALEAMCLTRLLPTGPDGDLGGTESSGSVPACDGFLFT